MLFSFPLLSLIKLEILAVPFPATVIPSRDNFWASSLLIPTFLELLLQPTNTKMDSNKTRKTKKIMELSNEKIWV